MKMKLHGRGPVIGSLAASYACTSAVVTFCGWASDCKTLWPWYAYLSTPGRKDAGICTQSRAAGGIVVCKAPDAPFMQPRSQPLAPEMGWPMGERYGRGDGEEGGWYLRIQQRSIPAMLINALRYPIIDLALQHFDAFPVSMP